MAFRNGVAYRKTTDDTNQSTHPPRNLLVVIDLDQHGNHVIDTEDHDERGPFDTHADLREAIREILMWSVKVALAIDAVTENPMRKPDPA